MPPSQRGKKLDGLVCVWDWYGTFATLAGVSDFTDKSAAAAGLPAVDSHALWPYLSGAVAHSPRTEVQLGSCSTADAGHDPFCGNRGTNTTVQGLIVDERATGGGLWKALVGSVWQAVSWECLECICICCKLVCSPFSSDRPCLHAGLDRTRVSKQHEG